MSKAVITAKQPTPVERFIGGEVRVLATTLFAISNVIQGECYEVALPEDESREDKGMLSLYPIADNKFCLELSYLQLSDASSSAGNICILRFLPAFFDQYPAETLMANQPFRFDQSTQMPFPICAKSRALLDKLQAPTAAKLFIKSLEHSELAMRLLRCALECITIPFEACQVPACRFLAYESEREKIQDARRIIERNIDQPHTIRDLARKVAMNECYLKKGFKTVTGRTIHEYQQELRIAKAKELLQHQGRSVTDVANTLGYSSISHFSTAFKRVTGLKPCELLK
jgi:AraC-like DNA-binding protein